MILAYLTYYYIYDIDNIVIKNSIVIFIFITIIHWIYNSYFLIKSIPLRLFFEMENSIVLEKVTKNVFIEVFNILPYSFIVFFTLISIYKYKVIDKEYFTIIIINTVLLYLFIFPGPNYIFDEYFDFNLYRMGEYNIFYTSLSIGIGIYIFFSSIKKNLSKILLVILFIFVFLSISNDFVSSDNPIIKRPFYTNYLTNKELASFKYIDIHNTNIFYTDYVANRYFITINETSEVLQLNNNTMNLYRQTNDQIILFRLHEYSKRPIKLYIRPNKHLDYVDFSKIIIESDVNILY
jgi:hypothetical protein